MQNMQNFGFGKKCRFWFQKIWSWKKSIGFGKIGLRKSLGFGKNGIGQKVSDSEFFLYKTLSGEIMFSIMAQNRRRG